MGNMPNKLAAALIRRREELGLSVSGVAVRAGLARSTYLRLETGQISEPRAENLQAIADALELPVGDLYALAGRISKRELPTLQPYLRTKYNLTDDAAQAIQATFQGIADRYGIDFDREYSGPRPGEDE